MTAWTLQSDTVTSCTETRSGEYLVITTRGYTAMSPRPVSIGKRIPIRAGQPQLSKSTSNVVDAPLKPEPALRALAAIDKFRGDA